MSRPTPWKTVVLWLGLVGTLLLVAKLHVGAWHGWDLRSWDGAWYFGWAHDIATAGRPPSPESSPVYCAYYAVFHGLFDDVYTIFFAHRVVALVAIAGLAWWLFARLGFPVLAGPAAAWLLWLNFREAADGYTARPFVLVPLLAACLFACSRWRWRGVGVVICAALGAGVRPELGWTFPLLVIGVVLLEPRLLAERLAAGQRRRLLVALLVLGMVLSVPVVTGSLAPSKRSIMAFGQHYGVGVTQRDPAATADPWLEWPEYLAADFGEVASIPGAARANPAAFARHLAWNARQLPRNACLALLPHDHIPDSHLGLGAWGVAGLLGALLPAAWWSRRRRGLALPWREHALLGLLLASTLLGLVISALVIFPQDFVMQGWRVLALLLVLAALQELVCRHLRGPVAAGASALAIAVLLCVLPSPTREPRELRVLAELNAVERIFAASDAPAIGLMAYDARALCRYLRDDRCLEAHPHWVRPQPDDIEGWLVEHQVGVMVIELGLVVALSDAWKDYLRAMAATPDHLGWRRVDHGSQYEIWVRLGG